MELEELVIRIQVAADGVEETIAQLAEGVRDLAAQAEAAAGRWTGLSVQARAYAGACAQVETALGHMQAAMTQADGVLERGFVKAQERMEAASAQLSGIEAQLLHLPEGQLRLDSGPALSAIGGVMEAWNSACAAMRAQAGAGRGTQVVQNVHFNTAVQSPGDTLRRMEEVNVALGRLLK